MSKTFSLESIKKTRKMIVLKGKELLPTLRALNHTADVQDKVQLLTKLEPRTLGLICSCVDRVINNRGGSRRLKKEDHAKLRKILEPVKRPIKVILNKSSNDKSKRRALKQNGGALASIIATILPLLISTFSSLIKPKK